MMSNHQVLVGAKGVQKKVIFAIGQIQVRTRAARVARLDRPGRSRPGPADRRWLPVPE